MTPSDYGATMATSRENGDNDEENPLVAKEDNNAKSKVSVRTNNSSSSLFSCCNSFILYIVYALVNVIIAIPSLYGYAAVIFNHPVFSPYMNALSKFAIFSSLMHQLGFTLFSSLSFSIGTVQDAGLIFLSAMSNTIANKILYDPIYDNESDETKTKVIVSTTIVLLSVGTASLGAVLILMGKFRLADIVSYLPLPVVGGYLAFIGYFCLQAGVALCISHPMVTFFDWKYMFISKSNFILALPGLASGLLLTYVSRSSSNPSALPMTMVAIPAVFYIVIFSFGFGLEGAREGNWVGDVSEPVPVSDLILLIKDAIPLCRWDLILEILPTWVGMVFVVSFASCLDVAAISMDMGVVLDTNKELSTVGICNLMSGLTFGYTGSYIFSQTIFTYRTGVHSRWIGIFIMFAFFYVVVSPINILEIVPLFFLGATLIFIGYDLLFEWLYEIKYKIFLSDYIIVWITFIAIQIIGIDFGIILGVGVAIVEHVFTTARTLTINKVMKRSKAIWTPNDYKLLHQHGYCNLSSKNIDNRVDNQPSVPKILTLEITGSIFFGSSLQLLEMISSYMGMDMNDNEKDTSSLDAKKEETKALLMSPHRSPYGLTTRSTPMSAGHNRTPGGRTTASLTSLRRRRMKHNNESQSSEEKHDLLGGQNATSEHLSQTQQLPSRRLQQDQRQQEQPKPQFVVLDLTQVPNLDASATRGCFLQLINMCCKHNIILCASGLTTRVDWMLRSHDVAYKSMDEENSMKGKLLQQQCHTDDDSGAINCERILLFLTVHEALEFCETILIHQLKVKQVLPTRTPSFMRLDELVQEDSAGVKEPNPCVSSIFSHILGISNNDDEYKILVDGFEKSGQRYHTEVVLNAGNEIFVRDTYSDSFCIVLRGAVAVARGHIDSSTSSIGSKNKNSKSQNRHHQHGGDRGSGVGTPLQNRTVVAKQRHQKKQQQQPQQSTSTSSRIRSNLLDVKEEDVGSMITAFYQVGSIFGYVDFLLERSRQFRTVASQDKTIIAKISKSQMTLIQNENEQLHAILQKVLLQASILDLANCTCDE